MNTQLVDQHWFISLNGKRYGPYTFAALTEAAAKGVITADTNVWRLGWQQWHPASRVPGLLEETPPVPASADTDSELTEAHLPELEAEGATSPLDDDQPSGDDEADSPRLRDRRPGRDEYAPRDARNARSRQPSREEAAPRAKSKRPEQDEDDAADGPRPRDRWLSPDEDRSADSPRPRDKRPSRGEEVPRDAARLRDRRPREMDDEAPLDAPKPRDPRRSRTEEVARDAATPRDRGSVPDEDSEAAKPRARRPAPDEDASRAARQRDRWTPRDEDAPGETPRLRDRRSVRDEDDDLDAPTLRKEPEDDDAVSDVRRPRVVRPPRDDDTLDETPRPRNKRSSRDDDAARDAPRLRGTRPPRDEDVAPDDKPRRRDRRLPDDDEVEDAPHDEWGVLDVRPSADDDGMGPVVPRLGREKTSKAADLDEAVGDVAQSRSSNAKKSADKAPAGGRLSRIGQRAAIWLAVILVLAAAGWGLFASGLAGAGWGMLSSSLFAVVEQVLPKRAAEPKPQTSDTAGQQQRAALVPASGLHAAIVNLPAVVALQRSDPAAFDRFKKRFTDSAENARDDEILSLARAALRKSVKRQLANAPGDTLLEITEAYLAYMQGLQSSSPESCVALSDESKGAKLTANLAKEFPVQFIRDMSVLERVAGTKPSAAVTPLTADQARPYLETVFNNLRLQPVKSELLGRDKLNPPEFQPYCALVIAFYQAVLEMPRDDKVNLLRYLYATAAVDADSDLAK
jgi:hypothetical protein